MDIFIFILYFSTHHILLINLEVFYNPPFCVILRKVRVFFLLAVIPYANAMSAIKKWFSQNQSHAFLIHHIKLF